MKKGAFEEGTICSIIDPIDAMNAITLHVIDVFQGRV
jgi:hypothetical protein